MLPDPFSSKISRGSVLLHLSVLLQLNCKCLKTQWINRNSIAVRVFENVILCTIWTYLHLKSSENSRFLFSNPTFSAILIRTFCWQKVRIFRFCLEVLNLCAESWWKHACNISGESGIIHILLDDYSVNTMTGTKTVRQRSSWWAA